ncbi:MAG: efflux transporter periplasmic adaptor subunit, partial [Xanthomonas sp.]|nr:efflux transporter periplasmic adaptor subunit [Xanthomonas sp.]
MILMLIGVAVVFGGVFIVKGGFSAKTNEFFDNMPQPAAAVTDWTAKQQEWID